MLVKVPSWQKVLEGEFEQPYMQELKQFLKRRKRSKESNLSSFLQLVSCFRNNTIRGC